MSLKRKIFNLFAAVVMIFGSMPISFVNTHAADDEPTGIVPEEENIPKSLKTVHANGDGTYDITLEIEGVSSQKTDATKANVVVVFDSSGSMGDNETIYTYTESASGRFRKADGDYLQLYRRNSWGNCSRMDSDNSSTQVYPTNNDCVNQTNRYTGTRYTRSSTTGTRLGVAKSAVNVLANELLSQNDSTVPDMVEMAFVDFSTFIKTNTTHTTPTTSLDTFKSWVNATDDDGGTNWEAALTAAKDVDFDDNDKTYIIFVSDGNPTYRDSQYDAGYYDSDGCRRDHRLSGGGCSVWGDGQNDPNPYRNFNAAKDVADEIIGMDNVEFYTVGAFGDATNMQGLGGTYYNATNQDKLEEAFAEIVDKINMGLSVADLQIADGITPATSTEIDGAAGNFRYSVPESWGDDYGKANFEGGSVHWNPGEHKTLSSGEKASVTFTVWPSQEAMDCIAALRNDGTCDETDLTKFGLGTNDNGFYLITNSTATFRFKTATKNEDTGETEYSEISIPIDFKEERDPTDLPETTVQVTKKWIDTMVSQREDISNVSIDLYVDREKNPERERHYTFEYQEGTEWIGEDENGESEYTVAPGVMRELDGTEETAGLEEIAVKIVRVGDKRYAVLEEGHDYEFDGEVVDYSGSVNHYHITKRDYHPMIVNDGGIHNVIFNDDAAETEDGLETAVIEEEDLETLSVENTLNGGILVSKVVMNNGEVDETIEDEYEITIFNIKDADGNILSHTDENPMQYRIQNCSKVDGEEQCVNAGAKKPFYDGTVTEKIKTNQKIMVSDLPTGATFEVKETQPEGYQDYELAYQLVRYDESGNEEVSTESEDVQKVFGNASAQAIVTNKLESGDLKITKEVTATSGDLTKAQDKTFSFTVNFYKEGSTEPVRTDTETCAAVKHGESCEIKNIPAGWTYEITEAARAGFNGGNETVKTGTIKAREEVVEKFENEYAVAPVDAKIVAHKAFVDGYQQFWIDSDNFEFQLIGNNQVIDSTTVNLSGSTAEFDVEFTEAGTYTYTVTEKTQDENGESVFRQGVLRNEGDEDIVVTVVVTEDDENGVLRVDSISYSKTSQTIYNLYKDTKTYGVDGELEFTKDLQGRDWRSSDEFNFVISGSEGAPMPAETTVTADKDHKTVDFGTISFTEENVGETYVYTVTEEYDVPSVEPAEETANGITFTVEVEFDEEEGTLNLVVSEHDDTFVNIYKTTDVAAAKVWDDDEDRDGLRKNYESYFVAVKNDEGKFVAYEALALEDKDDYSFAGLPEKNAEGEAIEYTIVEASACSGSGENIECTEFDGDDDYAVTVENGVITNFHKPELYNETGELTVQKIWAGEGNELMRPDSITVELLANGETIDSTEIMAGQDGAWTHTFTDLYMNEGGEPIEYSVQESKLGETAFGENESVIVILTDEGAVAGSWTKSVDNEKYEVTNTWTESEDEIVYEGASEFYIKKVDEDGEPMEGVTFTIGENEEQTDADGMITVTVPVSDKEKEDSFEYEISEFETITGYDLAEGSATVTVSCTSELSNVDTDSLVNTYIKTCEFSEEGDEAFEWDAEELTLTVVNERSLAKSLTIKKTVEGLSAEVLTDLEFTIEGPEDFGEEGKLTLKASEDCTISDDTITCDVDDRIPTGNYTVTESNAEVEYFELTVSGDNETEKEVAKDDEVVFEITNTYDVEKVEYYVDKVWEDEHNKDGSRPESLTINLLANGEVVDTLELTMNDAYIIDESDEDYVTGDIWGSLWEGLPYADENAEVIVYTVEEVLESDDYEQLAVFGDEYASTFLNYHEPVDPCAEGGCGGDVIPPAPNTGMMTGLLGAGLTSAGWVGNVFGGIAIIVLGVSLFVAGRREEENVTK